MPRAIVCGVLFGLTLAAGHAQAAPAAADPEIVALNRKAIASYKAGHSEPAMVDLRAALRRANEQGLGRDPVAAQTELHLGVVAIAGLDDWLGGMEHFARALAIDPKIKLSADVATPVLERDLVSARRIKLPATSASASASTDDPDADGDCWVIPTDVDEPPLPKPIPQPLYCPTPDLGPTGESVPLFCVTQPSVGTGDSKVLAYYRSTGAVAYTPLAMKRSKTGWLTAAVPPKAVKGRALQVYFEAHDRAGGIAASNGMDETPNVILLKAGAPRIRPRSLTLVEAGTTPRPKTNVIEATPLELRVIAEDKAEVAALSRKGSVRRAAGRYWMGLGLGGGYGWHVELPLERHPGREVTAGLSSTGLGHFSPEFGYQWNSRLSLSLQTRHQYLPAAGSGDAEVTGSPPELAHAALARLQYALLGLGDLQLMGSFAVGGGSALRMSVAPDNGSGVAASDTVVAGPVAAGVGVMVVYNFSSRFMGTLELRGLGAFPAVAVVTDLTAGVQIAF